MNITINLEDLESFLLDFVPMVIKTLLAVSAGYGLQRELSDEELNDINLAIYESLADYLDHLYQSLTSKGIHIDIDSWDTLFEELQWRVVTDAKLVLNRASDELALLSENDSFMLN